MNALTPSLVALRNLRSKYAWQDLWQYTNDGLRPRSAYAEYKEARRRILCMAIMSMRLSMKGSAIRPTLLNRHQRRRVRSGTRILREGSLCGIPFYVRPW